MPRHISGLENESFFFRDALSAEALRQDPARTSGHGDIRGGPK